MSKPTNGNDMPVPTSVSSELRNVPEEDRQHPLFRRGYSMGYSHRAREESLAKLEQYGPRILRDGHTDTHTPRYYGIGGRGLLDSLEPGVRIDRELLAMTEQDVITETPCCARQITVPIPEDDQTRPAVCCRCGVFYQMHLRQEEPDGFSDDPPPYLAVFSVEHLNVASARHRAGRAEKMAPRAGRHR